MRTENTVHFDTLAREIAVTIGATVRRWWLEPKHAQRLHVEAVRTFVGAQPVVVQFTATLDTARPPQLRGKPQMQVIMEPPLSAPTSSSANGTSPNVPRRSRTPTRGRRARPRTRTTAHNTPATHAQTTTTRTRRKPHPRNRSRARR